MAETAPWLQPKTDDSNVAPWLAEKPKVGVGEDVGKGLVSGLAQGAIAIPGMGGDIQSLAKAGADKAGLTAHDPLGWITGKLDENFPNAMKFVRESNAKSDNAPVKQIHSGDMPVDIKLPTSADLQAKAEEATGPFYQAQTGLGKAAQTAAQIAPSLAVGGETLPATLAKAAGAGATSELAGEGANALKGHLPTAAQPYAEPVARAVGAIPGLFAPAAARRVITPLPMSDERLATVNALRNINPELVNASTAGQLTESPRIAALEGRAPSMANLPQRQNEAYTQGVMRQAGSNGMFDAAGLTEAQGTGAQLEALRNSHNMSVPQFASLNQDINSMSRPGSDLFRAVGPSKPFNDVRDAIKGGPTGGNPQPFDMTGQRYGALKQIIQNAADSAPTSHEQIALANARQRMMDAFHNSMPPAEADRLRNLDQQYSNYKTINSIPTREGENTLTPKQVYGKAARNSDLETHADQASRVMTPLPERNTEISPVTQMGAAVGNSLLHGGAGLHYGGAAGGIAGAGEGFLGGLFGAEPAVNAVKDLAGRVTASGLAQAYFKKQLWRPGPHSSADPATIARLLMSPPAKALLPDDRK